MTGYCAMNSVELFDEGKLPVFIWTFLYKDYWNIKYLDALSRLRTAHHNFHKQTEAKCLCKCWLQ